MKYITLCREDYKAIKGKSCFDLVLSGLKIPKEKQKQITEIDITVKIEGTYDKNDNIVEYY